MSAILSTGFSPGIASQILTAAPSVTREAVKTNDLPQGGRSNVRDIKDTANLSTLSQRLSTTSEDATPLPVPQEIVKDNLAAVKNYISGHTEEAFDQQANQSPRTSFSLICGTGG